jgi:RIO-like serine/threonine protein kinase
LLRDGVIEKHFISAAAAAFEAYELRRLRAVGVRVPQVYALDGAVVKMQYIPGEALPDIIERLDNSDSSGFEAMADGLIGWLGDFYRAADTDSTGEIRGDVNGRNFLFDGACCWSVDFEERVYGVKEQDIGRLIAFILTYDPPGTPLKTAFADVLLSKAVDSLGVKREEALNLRDLEFQAIRQRRRK